MGQRAVFWDHSMRVLTAFITREYMGKSSCLSVISTLFGIRGPTDMPKVSGATRAVGVTTSEITKVSLFGLSIHRFSRWGEKNNRGRGGMGGAHPYTSH